MKTTSNFVLLSSISVTKQVLIMLLFNTIVALIIYRLVAGINFSYNLIISQLIGFSVYSCFHLIYRVRFHFYNKTNKSFSVTFLSLVVGSIVGVSMSSLFTIFVSGISVMDFIISNYDIIIQNGLFALIFGAIVINFIMSRESLFKATAELQKNKLSLLANEKTIIESELKLLQSQIEPHFLFNTLSNVIGLIESDPMRSKSMLESLTHYLRATLDYTRRESAIIEDEIKMITAYLDIFKERMGKRLTYHIDVDSEIYHQPFAPMLLQPIVENAITHGIEPLVRGGHIKITGQLINDMIKLTIEDNGGGINQDSGHGVGLTNVQQRLKAIYSDDAVLELQNSEPHGLHVTIEIPYQSA